MASGLGGFSTEAAYLLAQFTGCLDAAVDVAAFVVSCVSALIAVGSLWYARGQKKAADKSAAAAERSASSSERAEVHAEKSADAAEASATSAAEMIDIERDRRAEEVAQAERGRVRWELQRGENDGYVLRNAGTDTAYGVQVTTAPSPAIHGRLEIDEFPDDHAEQYVITASLGNFADLVVVTWHHRPDRSDNQQRHELPF